MSKISSIESYNRPREKALTQGISSLTNQELLAIIIRCGIKGISSLELAEHIIKEYGSLYQLFNADLYSLMHIKGIKKAKALELISVIELSKRVSKETNREVIKINNSDDIYKIFKTELGNSSQEQFIVVFLNINLKIIKKEVLFIGGESSSLIDVNLLYKKALLCGAKKIICLHNHPSGELLPSKEDLLITEKIKNIGEILKITLLDHLIITKNDYFSFKKEKIL